MICLDSNAVVAAINRRSPGVRQRLERALTAGMPVGIPTIVIYELWTGIHKSPRLKENTANLATFLALDVTPWSFDPGDAEEAGEIRAALERAGTPIGPYDVLIAAQARRRSAILITRNQREFARVSGLRTEDWTLPEEV